MMEYLPRDTLNDCHLGGEFWTVHSAGSETAVFCEIETGTHKERVMEGEKEGREEGRE